MESSRKEYNKLGETYITADNWDHYDNITKQDVMGAGTHAYMGGELDSYDLAMGRWYRSKEKLSGNYPYGGYLTNKKWHLNEEMSKQYKSMH